MEIVVERWSTWEELLLGGAVLRHGTGDWNVIAAELRSRTVYPDLYTPEICKAKYKEIKRRYAGCNAWYEELRKNRIAELKKALEQSVDSIGSLESKLKSLKAETQNDCQVDYDSSRTESLPCQKSEGLEYTSKETSKVLLSAASFTHRNGITWSPREDLTTDLVNSRYLWVDKLPDSVHGGQVMNIRRRRGKRKRKDCSKDASFGESNVFGIGDASVSRFKENSVTNSDRIARFSDDRNKESNKESSEDSRDELVGIYNDITAHDCASVFRRRLDSQKRGRYKKMVLRHMDFDTIKSRIADHSISTPKELFFNMLLVATNAVIFYSRNTHEHKSAVLLRNIVNESLKQHLGKNRYRNENIIISASVVPSSSPAKKLRSIRKPPAGEVGSTKILNGGRKIFTVDSPPSVESTKKVVCGRVRRVNSSSGRSRQQQQRSETTTPVRGRKRVRVR